MIRQAFLRLVWHIRGIENVIEHFFHCNAFYAFNKTHDHFGLRTTFNGIVENPMFVVDFIWDDFNDYLNHPVVFNADLRIIGTSYYNFNATKIIHQMQNVSTSYKDGVIFLTMPIVKWKIKRKHIVRGNLSQINEWIKTNR